MTNSMQGDRNRELEQEVHILNFKHEVEKKTGSSVGSLKEKKYVKRLIYIYIYIYTQYIYIYIHMYREDLCIYTHMYTFVCKIYLAFSCFLYIHITSQSLQCFMT